MLLELFNKPVGFFLLAMAIILITPLLSERLRLPGIIIGGMLIGPHGFGLMQDGDRIQFLATIGLVYLMFSAGLEVDINQFMRVRTRALVFGIITFAFPQLMGMGLGYILGLDLLGMILLGSAFEALLTSVNSDQSIKLEALTDHLKPEKLEHEAISSFIILPGFGSRKRVADTLGNIPEQLAKSFDGNLAILHFDK